MCGARARPQNLDTGTLEATRRPFGRRGSSVGADGVWWFGGGTRAMERTTSLGC